MSGALAWARPDPAPALAADEVHVWRASLDAPADTYDMLRAMLSHDECARAERFHADHDRRRFVIAHAFLRDRLAHYAGAAPRDLRFGSGAFGKPHLLDRVGGRTLSFNLSHSRELALLAVSWDRAVGVDVEATRDGFDLLEVAELVFSPSERQTLVGQTGPARSDAFYACWSRKEAYIKATGFGVSEGLHHFDVSLAPGAPAELLADRRDPAALRRWRLRALDPGPGYAGALVAEGQEWQVQCWEWCPGGGMRHSSTAS